MKYPVQSFDNSSKIPVLLVGIKQQPHALTYFKEFIVAPIVNLIFCDFSTLFASPKIQRQFYNYFISK